MVRSIILLVAVLAFASAAQAQTAPADAVQAGPPPVEDYGKLPAWEHVTLSPSGSRYAYIARVQETSSRPRTTN